jgi:hypothetical protein
MPHVTVALISCAVLLANSYGQTGTGKTHTIEGAIFDKEVSTAVIATSYDRSNKSIRVFLSIGTAAYLLLVSNSLTMVLAS